MEFKRNPRKFGVFKRGSRLCEEPRRWVGGGNAGTATIEAAMKELNWGGLGSSYAASKLIARREPFSLVITGKAADALKSVAGPDARFDRELLAKVASNLSLTTLPAVMLYALGRRYRLEYDRVEEGIRMRFLTGGEGEPA